ncbi:MAG: hypothetical protein D6767_05090 [Candidatus Hydrogenedentota bacterium]|nr:MAG: hypothetical protein D6767_05090 [Candidatus Hydrogenedentota bacterium]
MKLARVIGSVVSTVKHEVLNAHKLLIIKPIDIKTGKLASPVIGIDTVQAGPGDLVLYIDEGNSARQILNVETAPVRTVIMAIVDEVELK